MSSDDGHRPAPAGTADPAAPPDDAAPPPRRVPSPDDPTRTSTPSTAPHSTPAALPLGDADGSHSSQRPRDRYQLIGEHGRGGLGRVSRAHDRELDRDVAIKELISRAPLSEVRFLREALITARLEHPNIVPVHEAGRWPDGTPFYAMKLVAGRSLRELIAERHTVGERIALLHHVIAVADAIAYAHGRNIIHRDLKPANVIVGDFGETIVIDWGLAKDLSVSDDALPDGSPSAGPSPSASIELTTTGSVLGTPAYMAPEQERGEHVDQRADVFAIGAMLWELCALHKVPPSNVHQRHRVLRRAGIDGDLVTILDKSLDPDPARRYPDAGALAADLKAFKSGVRIAARSYSLPAMLAHWTRRHRGLALSIVAAIAVASLGIVLYVRNISVERDRANTQTIEAERQRADATAARDRAQLSEINTLLEKDPTRALELLQKVTDRTPQYALLMSRATQRAAAKVIKFKDRLIAMRQATDKAEVAIVTEGGELFTMPIETGELHLVDKHAVGPLTYGDGAWWYTRRPFGTSTQATNNRPGAPLIDTRGLASENESNLFVAEHHLYEYDEAGDVYRLDGEQPVRIARNIRRTVANDKIALACDRTNKLTIKLNHKPILDSTCANATTTHPLAVAGEHYAVLRDPSSLLVDGHSISIPAPLSTSHELAMAPSGLLAIADYQGSAWFVRPGSSHIEMAPRRPMSPLSTAAADSLVAWGYQDGSSVVLDTISQEMWEFVGQSEAVGYLALDPIRHRLVTANWHELRIWNLTPNPLKVAKRLPCTPSQFSITASPVSLALNCTDSSIRTWDTQSNQISTIHQHAQYADGLAQYKGMLCSGGWDGSVICSALDGSIHRTLLRGHGRIYGLVSCPEEKCLLAGTADGNVWRLSDQQQVLFKHTDVPSVLSTSPDGKWLASGAEDGSLVLYNLETDRRFVLPTAHRERINVVVWNGPILWTAGRDGVVKSWQFSGDHATPHDEYAGSDAIVSLAPLQDGGAMGINPKYLVLSTTSRTAVNLDADRPILAIQESNNHRYLAAITYEELLVVDLQQNSLTAIRPTSRNLQCLYFLRDFTLALCGRGSILTVDLTQLSYVPYLSDLPSKLSP